MQKILVLRGGALGDFILTLPAIALLRQRWPEAQIELVGNATAAALSLPRGLLDRVHSQHEARWSSLFGDTPLPPALATWLAEFDLVVNYWPDPEGELARRFQVHGGQTYLSAAALPVRKPAAAHYCEPLRDLGLSPSTLHYFISPIGTRPAATASRDGVIIHPGSGSPRKNWPLRNWRELSSRLMAPTKIILGPAELERARGADMAPWPGETLVNRPLEKLVDELSRCRLFLGHDAGISHLAAVCGAHCVLLFGPTDPAMWAPQSPHVRVIQRDADLSSISVDEVATAVAEALEDRR